MKKALFHIFLFLIISSLSPLSAQQELSDSLTHFIQTAKADTNKVNALNDLSQEGMINGDYENAEKTAKEALILSNKLGFKKGSGRAFNIIGNINNVEGNADTAIVYYIQAITIRKALGDKEGTSSTLSNLGTIYDHKGEFPKALNYYMQSLKISEELGDKYGMASCMNNIGNVFIDQRNYAKALDYQQQALKLHEEIGDKKGIATAYGNIANIYNVQGDYEDALEFNMKAADLMKEAGDKKGIGRTLNNLANTLNHLGKNEKALEYYMQSLVIREQIGHTSGIISSLNGISDVYLQLKRYDKALQYLQKGLELSKKIGDKEANLDSYQGLSQVYEGMGQPEKALEYFKLYSQLKDSLLNDNNSKQIAQMSEQYDSERKDNEIKLLGKEKEKQDLIHAAENKKQKVITGVIATGLIFVLIFAFFVFRSSRQKQRANKEITRQKEIIEVRNKEVHDSITYAKRIQSAILPSDRSVKESFPGSFVLFKPKDIVSGDFYWIQTIAGSETVLIAAADCTGHGVPGAMVSVVCSNALNRAVKEFGLIEPAAILNKVRELVVETFVRKNSYAEKGESDVKDGMDISLCSLNHNTGEVQWAGANNPLWMKKKNENAIIEIKGDKQPIGKFDLQKPFTNHRIQMQQGDSMYLFTDGYADQFGGEKGKKFKYKQMQEIILTNAERAPDDQKRILDTTIEMWRQNIEQVDDILIIGIKI